MSRSAKDKPAKEIPAKDLADSPVDGTRLESVEEIRRVLAARRAQKSGAPNADFETKAFRPVHRPPTAVLCVLDDVGDDGECTRIRTDRFVIGRSEGDLLIPHDTVMSGRHAEILRLSDRGRFRWYLADLRSTNGTYVRIGGSILKHGQEMLVGSSRLRFEASSSAPNPAGPETSPVKPATQAWHSLSQNNLFSSMVELTAEGEGQRISLAQREIWIGRDPTQCAMAMAQDALLSPRHARLFCDHAGIWHVENHGSLNGVWLRVNKIPLDRDCQFRLGEQRFLLRIP